MSTETNIRQEHDDLASQRDHVVERLGNVVGALDEKRRKVTHEVTEAAATAERVAGNPEVRTALVGAVAGGTLIALGLLVEHRRRERNRPINLLRRAWKEWSSPPRPSWLARVVRSGLRAIASTVANEAANLVLSRLRAQLDQGQRGELPEPDARTTPVQNPAAAQMAPVPLDTWVQPTAIEPTAPFRPAVAPPSRSGESTAR